MDWLKEQDATVRCGKATLSFLNNDGQEVSILGVRGTPKLQLVCYSKMLKAYKRKQAIYAVKLNPVDKQPENPEPNWISKYDDVFPEELTELPPKREVDHAIELLPGAQPVARRPYKMSLPEATELKRTAWSTP